jgi:hypothetical protein
MEQFRKAIVQTMAVFSGLKVAIGKNDNDTGDINYINVPIKYGSADRVVAAIKAENTQNAAIRVPMLALKVTNIDLAEGERKGTNQKIKTKYLPFGGKMPDDLVIAEMLVPYPYRMVCELAILASNTHQHFQMLEQILMLFDPTLQIQTSDDPLDHTKIKNLKLESIGFDENYPSGTERRLIVTNITIEVIIYLTAPVQFRKDYIKSVVLRMNSISDSGTAYEAVSALNNETGEKIIDIEDLDIPES